jgi:hypothetical protein
MFDKSTDRTFELECGVKAVRRAESRTTHLDTRDRNDATAGSSSLHVMGAAPIFHRGHIGFIAI